MILTFEELSRSFLGRFWKVLGVGGSEETLRKSRKAHARELEKGDPDTKVSDGMKGYWTLVRSRLPDEEVKHVIGLSGGQLKLSLSRQHLTELYPRGSYKSGGPRAYLANDDGSWLEGAYGEGWDELDDAWPADGADEESYYSADDGEDAAYWAWAREAAWYGDSWDAAPWHHQEDVDELAELHAAKQSEDKEVASAAKTALEAYYSSETGKMNFVQAQRTF